MNVLHVLILYLHLKKLYSIISLHLSLGYILLYILPNLDELFNKVNGPKAKVLIH